MTQVVALDLVRLDAQTRGAISGVLVAEYAERMAAGDIFPLLDVFYDGETYILGDGHHRYHALKRTGRTEAEMRVHPGTRTDAVWFALQANRMHGRRLTGVEKHHAIVLALTLFGDRSNRQIAEQVGCTDVYVSKVRKQVQTRLHLPMHVTGRDGKQYPVAVPKGENGTPSPQRTAVAAMVVAGKSSKEIQATLHAHTQLIASVRRELGRGTVDRSRKGVETRRERIRAMAADGYTSRQIAGSIGLTGDTVRRMALREGIDIYADKVVGMTIKHDPHRILNRIVMDADNLTEAADLIDFRALGHVEIADAITTLKQSRDKLGAFIRRLMQEQHSHGEAANGAAPEAPVPGPTGAHRVA